MDTIHDTADKSTTIAEHIPLTNDICSTIAENIPDEIEEICSVRRIIKVVNFCLKNKIGFLCLNIFLVIILTVLTFIAMVHITRGSKAEAQTCNDGGWVSFFKHCYYLGKEKKTWIDAESDCQKRFGHLAKIEDETENLYIQAVVAHVLKGDAWIGANDLDHEGQFKWVSDNSRVDAGFSDWSPGEPNNEHEDCVHYYTDKSYKWNDGACADEFGYICKK